MIEQSFTAPIKVTLGKKKFSNYWLSMNNYRSWFHHTSNNIKVAFKESLDLSHLTPAVPPVKLLYTFYYPNLSHRDIGNSLAVVDKFTADALVDAKIIPDDNYTVVMSVEGIFGGIDKLNPRCEVTIISQDNPTI